ncbi:MAG: hypothetical protein RBG13Loki_2949 [Promethearchaeota archaeon CR_4]|nr:MAG: hypothetical protein RBG13Loki_2949 [Candidatus Lokiarchaeota archaeon CR_4]
MEGERCNNHGGANPQKKGDWLEVIVVIDRRVGILVTEVHPIEYFLGVGVVEHPLARGFEGAATPRAMHE